MPNSEHFMNLQSPDQLKNYEKKLMEIYIMAIQSKFKLQKLEADHRNESLKVREISSEHKKSV